ncbi:MAG: chemotaxis protein CheC [Myxococcota bacterium]
MESTDSQDIERLVELTHAGAVRAATAFGQLANAPIEVGTPIARDGQTIRGGSIGSSDSHSARAGAMPAVTGVFFEFEGCLEALVGILFPAEGCERLVRGVVGIESGTLDPMIVESALMEVGNILASHVASGIADALRSRLLPSIPALAPEGADVEFDAWVDRIVGREALRIEAELTLATGEAVGRLVVVPTGRAASDPGREPSRDPSVC